MDSPFRQFISIADRQNQMIQRSEKQAIKLGRQIFLQKKIQKKKN